MKDGKKRELVVRRLEPHADAWGYMLSLLRSWFSSCFTQSIDRISKHFCKSANSKRVSEGLMRRVPRSRAGLPPKIRSLELILNLGVLVDPLRRGRPELVFDLVIKYLPAGT